MSNQQANSATNEFGEGLSVGDRHYRAWVGPPKYYDLVGALQFNVMTTLGLREYHSLLDIGCGSLRSGRLFIMYLRPGNYYGVEPEAWALEQGKRAQLGDELISLRRPTFGIDSNFTFSALGGHFDFLLAHSIFTHASAAQIRRCLSEAAKVMSEESLFVATFDESQEKNYEGDSWVYPGITEYTRSFMKERVEEAGLACHFPRFQHPWGQTWMVITTPDNTTDISLLEGGSQFSPAKYTDSHIWEERNETARSFSKDRKPGPA